MCASTWRKLQRVNRRAAKFSFTIILQDVSIEFGKHYKPHKLSISATRRNRRHATEPLGWTADSFDANTAKVIWDKPEQFSFDVTLYRDSKKSPTAAFDEKPWTLHIEEVMKNGHRRELSNRSIMMNEFVHSDTSGQNVNVKMKQVSKKVKVSRVSLLIRSTLLREGDATDEDMISVASLMSLGNKADVANLDDFKDMIDTSAYDELQRRLQCIEMDDASDDVPSSSSDYREHPPIDEQAVDVELMDNVNGPSSSSSAATGDPGIKTFLSSGQTPQATNTHSKPLESSNPCSTSVMAGDANATTNNNEQVLIDWCKEVTNGYNKVNVCNMTTSFRDGMAFCAILHNFCPNMIQFDALHSSDVLENNRLAFDVAGRFGIPRLIDPADMLVLTIPDRLSVMTYVHQLKEFFTNRTADQPVNTTVSPDSPVKESVMPASVSKWGFHRSKSIDTDQKAILKTKQREKRKKQTQRLRDLTKAAEGSKDALAKAEAEIAIEKSSSTEKLSASAAETAACSDDNLGSDTDSISKEFLEIEEEQRELDVYASDLERRLRLAMGKKGAADEESDLLAEWLAMIDRKNGLIYREARLTLLTKIGGVLKEQEVLDKRFRQYMKMEEWMKTQEMKDEERQIMEDVRDLVMKRDTLEQELFEMEQSQISQPLEHSSRVDRTATVETTNERKCVIQ